MTELSAELEARLKAKLDKILSLSRVQGGDPDPDAPPVETRPAAVPPQTRTANIIQKAEPSMLMLGALVGGELARRGGVRKADVVRGTKIAKTGASGPLGAPRVAPKGFGPTARVRGGAFEAARMALGSAIGTVEGFFFEENVKNLARALGIKFAADPLTVRRLASRSLGEGTLDLAFSSGGPVVGTAFRLGKAGVASMFGVTREGLRRAAEARSIGIDFSIADVTESQLFQFFPRVLGRFPLAGASTFSKHQARKGEQILAAKDRLFLRLGPAANMADMGIDLNKTMDRRFQHSRKVINSLYLKAKRVAARTGATMPVKDIIESAMQARTEFIKKRGPKAVNHPVIKFIDEQILSESALTGRIGIERLDGLMESIEEAMRISSKDGFSVNVLAGIKRGGERALLQLDNKEAMEKFLEADNLFATMMREIFETPVAQRAARVVKGRFHVKSLTRPGTVSPDKSFKVLFDAESAEGIRDLRHLVGPRKAVAAAATHFHNLFFESLRKGAGIIRDIGGKTSIESSTGGFDLSSFKDALGLGNKLSGRWKATKEALVGTGIAPERLKSFVNTVETMLDPKRTPTDVNVFIARRLTFGGIGAMKGLLLPGATVAASGFVGGPAGLVTGLAVVTIGRSFARIMTNPKLLNLAKESLDNTIPLQARRAKLLGLMSAVFPERTDDPNLKDAMQIVQEDGDLFPGIKVGDFQFENLVPELQRDVRGAIEATGKALQDLNPRFDPERHGPRL